MISSAVEQRSALGTYRLATRWPVDFAHDEGSGDGGNSATSRCGLTSSGSRMRLAFVGKGGAGKSSIAGTLARLLGGSGEPVLALDSDPMPGLAFSLGVERDDAGIPDEALEEIFENGRTMYRLRSGLTSEEAVTRYAAMGPDGIRFLQLGKARGARGENARSQQAFLHLVKGLPHDSWHLVGDLPGGTRQPFFGWGRYARTVVVVVEPTPASLLSARRLARLADTAPAPRVVAVANKTRAAGDVALVARKSGLTVVGDIPFDPGLATADRLGTAPVDHDDQSPAVGAVNDLLATLLKEEEVRT